MKRLVAATSASVTALAPVAGAAETQDSPDPIPARALTRRAFLRAAGMGAGAAAVLAALRWGGGPVAAEKAPRNPAGAPEAGGLVRLGAVNTPDYSGLLEELLADFRARSGLEVTLYSGEDVYQRARRGELDLIISHYGHRDVEAFMADGLGQWPRTVFANQQAILGPPSDPAGVRGLTDATEAFRRIAESAAPWLVNNLSGVRYLEAILWEGAGRPEKGDWYQDEGLVQARAAQAAGKRGAYTMWGIFPFLRFMEMQAVDLEPLVLADPLLQRIMVTVIVDPRRFPSANVEGAMALQQFLLAPATQARIRAFRFPGRDEQLWWPAGRQNHPSVLPEAAGR